MPPVKQGQNILIVGATSGIAESVARIWAAEGANLFLVARNPQRLELTTRDLESRGAKVQSWPLDVAQTPSCAETLASVFRSMGCVDVVMIAHGDLPDQRECEENENALLNALNVNAVSVAVILRSVAKQVQAQGFGVVAILGSVAGDRGRKSNYIYGAAKSLVATLAEGMAGRLIDSNVAVINIKPGFVDTPMTATFKKGLLWAQPEAVAKIIHARIAAGRSGSFYAPRFWWLIMFIIRHIPAPILYRLNI